MKKIIFAILLFVSVKSYSQSLDTVSVSLTIRSQDWAWAIGQYGEGEDSASKARIRQIRTAIIAANPPTWSTNVQINNLSGHAVFVIYKMFCQADFNTVIQMGSTNAERTTIYTNIRAINNSALQFFISQYDANYNTDFIRVRAKGKNILLDN